jgi:hypothetical protein
MYCYLGFFLRQTLLAQKGSFRFPGLFTACSLGLSATSQQYFSLRTNQPPATSRNQPAVLFSQNKPAPAISHQPTEQAVSFSGPVCCYFFPIRARPGSNRPVFPFVFFSFSSQSVG